MVAVAVAVGVTRSAAGDTGDGCATSGVEFWQAPNAIKTPKTKMAFADLVSFVGNPIRECRLVSG